MTSRVRALLGLSLIAVLFIVLVPVFGTFDNVTLLTQGFIFAIAAVSLDLVWGYTGILDLGHSIWFGFGALAVGLFTTTLGPGGTVAAVHGALGHYLLGIVVGVVATAVISGIVAWFAFSSRGQTGFYIAIVTLALGTVAGTLYLQFPTTTGGESGLFGFQYPGLSLIPAYTVAGVIMGIIIALGIVIARSDFGILMRAVRDQERRVSYFGYNLVLVKVLVFVGGAMLAALAGGLYGMLFGLASSDMFALTMATNFLVWTAVGGRATIIGPAVGAVIVNYASLRLDQSIPIEWELVVGLLFILVVVFVPDGVIAPLRLLFGRFFRGDEHQSRRLVGVPAPELAGGPSQQPIVDLQGIDFGYGSRRVLNNLRLEVMPAELLCIVGPNGAGKSTLLTVLADGRARYGGEIKLGLRTAQAHRRKPPHALARAGLVRKFQTPDLFPTLTVAETILLASRGGRLPSLWRRTKDVEVPAEVIEIAEATGLSEHVNRPGGLLAHGLKQGLELAAVVSNRPEVILLDEPTAGLTTNEREVIGQILTRLTREQHTTVILIEHDLDFVLRLADRIAVLATGTMVECAPAAEVANSPVVRDVYVGTVGAVVS